MAAAAWGNLLGILASSLAFGLWHVVPYLGRGAQVTAAADALGERAEMGFIAGAVVATAVAVLALTGLRLVSGSPLAPMLLHWTHNGAGLLAGATVARVEAGSGGRRPPGAAAPG